MVRPAFKSEARAQWYFEDGSAALSHCSKGFCGTEKPSEPCWRILATNPTDGVPSSSCIPSCGAKLSDDRHVASKRRLDLST